MVSMQCSVSVWPHCLLLHSRSSSRLSTACSHDHLIGCSLQPSSPWPRQLVALWSVHSGPLTGVLQGRS